MNRRKFIFSIVNKKKLEMIPFPVNKHLRPKKIKLYKLDEKFYAFY
jgi:hypothetical protein